MIEFIDGHFTTPDHFLAATVHCGLRKASQPDDLTLLYSEHPARVAGVFTTNKVKAAPVLYCQERVRSGCTRAVLVNAGNANACTGPQGVEDTREMASLVAASLKLPVDQVLVASTGIIGQPLPMEKLRWGVPRLADLLGRKGQEAALAITTTDAYPKTAAARIDLHGRIFHLGGMAKGAGMIHPDMATTLCFLATDAPLSASQLQRSLRQAMDLTFNSISVDGDTSTNDTALLLANGQGPELDDLELETFTRALTEVSGKLARLVVSDGEGATRLVEIRLQGARDAGQARKAAQTVGQSLLVKTMFWGGEPNWGRVLAALGRSGVELEESRVDIFFGDVEACHHGLAVPDHELPARDELQKKHVLLRVDLGLGSGETTLWTCDLGENYVRLNGSYMT